MSILIPSTESGVLEDIGALRTYNPIVEAYEDCDRAMEHDGDAWREVWPDGVSAYVYGAASETVTIKKDGIIVATVETDSSGRSAEKIMLSHGMYTLTGSVSGWTEEQTVNKDTTKFRAMPEGALYWYGNEVRPVTVIANSGPACKNINNITFGTVSATQYGGQVCGFTFEKINLAPYSKINLLQIPTDARGNTYFGLKTSAVIEGWDVGIDSFYKIIPCPNNEGLKPKMCLDVSDVNNADYHIVISAYAGLRYAQAVYME